MELKNRSFQYGKVALAVPTQKHQLQFVLEVLRTLGSYYCDRTFAAAGPRLWNSLPVQLRNPDIT